MRVMATLLPFFCLFACIRIPQTTALDAGLPRILVDGYPLHVERVGSAQQPPLIVIHGGPGADMSYLRSLDALSDTYYIIYYDQRGTGLSAREDPSGHSLERFVADLDAVVDAHSGGRPLRMLGHSGTNARSFSVCR